MLKRLSVALAALFAFVSVANGAGTVPGFSLVPQFDLTGKVAPGCKLYVIQAGTVSTPQSAYQDTGLTLSQPNPLLCDAAGRLPQWFVADGNIKLRLTTSTGTQIFSQDNLLVIGASSGGGGGGGSVDPTTILQTGWIQPVYGTGVVTGFVRCNGRTIGNATSGATERANADTSALFAFLWNGDANLAVSGGRGGSAAADYAAGKTIALPDFRGRVLAGLDDMGNSAAGIFTGATFGSGNATTLGSIIGASRRTLTLAQLPTGITVSGTVVVAPANGNNVPQTSGNVSVASATSGGTLTVPNSSAATYGNATGSAQLQGTPTLTSNNTSGGAHDTISPVMLATIYVKL